MQIRTLFNAMRTVLNDKDEKNWTKILPAIRDDFNVTVNKSTEYSPQSLIFGVTRRLRATDQLLCDVPVYSEFNDMEQVEEEVNKRMEKVTE